MQRETVHLKRELHKAELALQYSSSLRNMGKENKNFCCKKKNKRSVKSVLSPISMENKKDVSHRIPMIMTLWEGQPSPERSKKEIYQVDGDKNVGVLVECYNCGFIDESSRSKSKSSSSSSSSQDKDEDVTAAKSSKIAYIITYYFKCPNCSAEKTVLEHEQNDNDDEDEEDEDDDDDEEEGDPWSANLSNIKIRTPKDSFNGRFMCLFPPPIDRTSEVFTFQGPKMG